MKKSTRKIILAAVLALILLVPATMIPIFAAEDMTTYLFAEDFEEATVEDKPIKGEMGISSSTSQWTVVPSLATFANDPAGGSGKAIKVKLSTVNEDVTSDAAINEAKSGGDNIDKNLTIENPAIASTTYNKVVYEVDYFISENSRGVVQSQIINFSSTQNPTAGIYWMSLYEIDTATGSLYNVPAAVVGGKAQYGKTTLEIGKWQTVSIVFDMVNGTFELYVNNIKKLDGICLKGTVQQTNLTFSEGYWNVAKIQKTSYSGVGMPELFKGSFYVDNPRIHTNTATVTGASVASGSDPLLYIDVVGSTGSETLAGPNDVILATAKGSYNGIELPAVIAEAKYLTEEMTNGLLEHVNGASMRLSSPSGIRFGTRVDVNKLADLQALVTAEKIKAVNIGTIIAPWSYVKTAGAFTVDALEEKLTVSAKYLDVKATIGEYYADAGADGKATFTGSIVNIREQNLIHDFGAVGYVKLTLFDGTPLYIYSYEYTVGMDTANLVRNVASMADECIKLGGVYNNYLTVLNDLAGNKKVINTVEADVLTDIRVKNSQVLFTLKNGGNKIYCRLTYDGANGWRLQANAKNYNSFNDIGAAQALALYMDEGYSDIAANLHAAPPDITNKTLTVTSGDSATYAVISYGEVFNIDFCNASGNALYNVNSITQTLKLNTTTNAYEESIVMGGILNGDEAVYGGGERFDAANKRGQTMTLYTYDAYNVNYNNATGEMPGTYVAIPLFSTSNGGGMFINRYEIMDVTFGAVGTSDNWSVSIENDLIDTYFYATGKITDVLKAYTDMTGHASLPEEWAQGFLVCRYSPDFDSLQGIDGDPNGMSLTYATLQEVPNYTTYYTESITSKEFLNSGKTADSVKVTASTVCENGHYLFTSSGARIYRYVVEDDTDFNENGKIDSYFIRIHNSGGPVGAGVKHIVESLEAAGMKPTAMVLEGLNWTDISMGDATAVARFNNFKAVCDYLNEKGIKITVYMGVASLDFANMNGYKPEYSTSVTVYRDAAKTEAIGTTRYIPNAKASNNPDAMNTTTRNYLDITNPEAVDWYINTIWGQLVELGVRGCKIDFCELMPNEKYYTGMTIEGVAGVSGYLDYNWYDDTIISGDEVHHAYSTYFISMFYREMTEMCGKDGFVVLSRGGGIGTQRNPYIWAGDQQRLFGNMKTQFMATINSGLSGVPFLTYDMAGYNYSESHIWFGENHDGTSLYSRDWIYNGTKAQTIYVKLDNLKEAMNYESEIYVRSLQYTAFSTMIQTHGCVRHVYDLNSDAIEIAEKYTALHLELASYLQAMSKVACDTGMPIMRHMVLQYQDDPRVASIEDQYMFGEALLVAPVLEAKLTGTGGSYGGYGVYDHNYAQTMTRNVYLPEGTWIDLRTGEKIVVDENGKDLTVTVPFGEIPVYLNANSVYATALGDVFNGETWKAIMGDDALVIPVGSATDAFGKDIFED